MEDKIKGIQDTLDNIILEIIKKKEYNKNIESESIRKLYFLNEKFIFNSLREYFNLLI